MRQEKQLLLDEVKEKVTTAPAFVIASYKNLDPNLGFDFRKTVYAVGSRLCIVKKRLFLKAATEVSLTVDAKTLAGHIAIIFSGENTVGMAKAVYTFTKDYQDALEVLGGYFDGKICSSKEVEEISKLPSKDEMRAAFIGTLEAPMTQTLGVIEGLLTSIIHCLDGKINKSK
ncbi:MAG: 50S ribosomal protein L10 [Chlamydiota bacterium]